MNRPRVRISLGDGSLTYLVGEVLIGEYSIEIHKQDKVKAVESSVIWQTVGKGGEDIGVHFFERRPKTSIDFKQLKKSHKFSTVLPQSPLSYDGTIVQIQWYVRVRVFFVNGASFTEEQSIRLGKTQPFSQIVSADDIDREA